MAQVIENLIFQLFLQLATLFIFFAAYMTTTNAINHKMDMGPSRLVNEFCIEQVDVGICEKTNLLMWSENAN